MKVLLLITGLAAFAAAAERPVRRQQSLDQGSVIAVLETALPASLLQLAITNAPQATAIIASEFAAGQTPSWFTGLPADIKTYLVPTNTADAAAPTLATSSTSAFPTLIVSNITAAAGNASAYGTGTAVAPYPYAAPYGYGAGASNVTAIANNGTAIVANGTAAVRTTGSPSMTVTSLVGGGAGGAAASLTGTATARPASGAAAIPTAVMHAGLLGAAGVVAAFVL